MAKHRARGKDGNPPRDGLVAILLEYSGTPMRHLYEYPYNKHESDARIRAARRTVARLLDELEDSEKRNNVRPS